MAIITDSMKNDIVCAFSFDYDPLRRKHQKKTFGRDNNLVVSNFIGGTYDYVDENVHNSFYNYVPAAHIFSTMFKFDIVVEKVVNGVLYCKCVDVKLHNGDKVKEHSPTTFEIIEEKD